MPRHCALALDSVTPIRPGLCTERIAQLDSATMHLVCAALLTATDCG